MGNEGEIQAYACIHTWISDITQPHGQVTGFNAVLASLLPSDDEKLVAAKITALDTTQTMAMIIRHNSVAKSILLVG